MGEDRVEEKTLLLTNPQESLAVRGLHSNSHYINVNLQSTALAVADQ